MKLQFTLLSVVMLLTFSCKKYPEGPAISIRSTESRVANTWKAEQVTVNGNDATSAYTNSAYTEIYERDGKYSYHSSAGNGSGTWDFQQNKKQIKRQGVSGQPSVVLTILKLKEKSFWYTYSYGGDNYVFHLIPK